MPVYFGDPLNGPGFYAPCLDPLSLREECLACDPPIPVDYWWGRANSFQFGLGLRSGTGLVLVRRKDVRTAAAAGAAGRAPIRLDSPNYLTFDDGKNALCLYVSVRSVSVVTPGREDDPDAAVALELVDDRVLNEFLSVNRVFNHTFDELTAGINTYAEFGGGSGPGGAQTWAEIIVDICGQGNMASMVGDPLPASVDASGVPHNLVLAGPLVDAAEFALSQVGCTCVYNPIIQTQPAVRSLGTGYRIVRIGDADAAARALLDSWKTRGWLVWDERPRAGDYVWTGTGGGPQYVTVFFPIEPAPPVGKQAYFTLNVQRADSGALSLCGSGQSLALPAGADAGDNNADPLGPAVFDGLSARGDTSAINAAAIRDDLAHAESAVSTSLWTCLNFADLKARALAVARDWFDSQTNGRPDLLRQIGRIDPALSGDPADADWRSLVGPAITHFAIQDLGDGIRISVKRDFELRRRRPEKACHGTLALTDLKKVSQSYSLAVDLSALVAAVQAAIGSDSPITLASAVFPVAPAAPAAPGGPAPPVSLTAVADVRITRRWISMPLTPGQLKTYDATEYDPAADA